MAECVEYLECTCGCSVVRLEKVDGEMYLSTYERPGQSALRWRIEQAWRILRGESPYADAVILNTENTKRLREFLGFALEVVKGDES